MNIRFLTSSVAGVTLLALAIPTVAMARGDSDPAQFGDGTIVVVVEQDSGADKPKVEGWSTNPDEFTDEDCQGFADQIQGAIDDALNDLESNDIEGVFASLDFADSVEDLATTVGCAISFPQKSAPGGRGFTTPGGTVNISASKVEGWQTGDGPASDDKCQGYADTIQEALDDAEADLEAGDVTGGLNHLDLADAVEDAALNQGCAISYPV